MNNKKSKKNLNTTLKATDNDNSKMQGTLPSIQKKKETGGGLVKNHKNAKSFGHKDFALLRT